MNKSLFINEMLTELNIVLEEERILHSFEKEKVMSRFFQGNQITNCRLTPFPLSNQLKSIEIK